MVRNPHGIPKQDRTGKGWIGFGPAFAGSNDQRRQHAVSGKIKMKIKFGKFRNVVSGFGIVGYKVMWGGACPRRFFPLFEKKD
ncbi:MAG: hypothetical protein EBT75_00495 [Proteobacteria bacterium]|nr:hypothetical protein [Pseudomonadota bacterium]NBS49146.1 hypothetical protein [Verrucomicrobiota bacterium]NBS78459.1 hypothetical protein [bacterium]